MINGIKKRTFDGLVWSLLDFFFLRGISLIINIILARLLAPDAFGLIAMITIFIEIAQVFVDSGFSQALLQKKQVDDSDYSTIFLFNLGFSIIFYLILFISSSLISEFYSEPMLTKLIKVISIVVITNALSIIQITKLTKELNFKKQTFITFASSMTSGIIASILAFNGAGIWSIVANTLIASCLKAILVWISSKWHPSLKFNVESFKIMFKFSSKLLVGSLIDRIYSNIYSPIIGRTYSATDLGYFSNAQKYVNVFNNMISSTIFRVTFPIFSSFQDNPEMLKKAMQKRLKLLMFVLFPTVIGLIILAEPLFITVLGSQWQDSILYFQLLCMTSILYPIQLTNLNLLKIFGRTDLNLKIEIIKKISLTILIVLSIIFKTGIMGLILVQLTNAVISVNVNSYYSKKLINYSFKNQLIDIFPSFISSLITGIIMVFSRIILSGCSFIVELIIGASLGIITYVSINYFFKIPELFEGLSLLKNLVKDLKKKRVGQTR